MTSNITILCLIGVLGTYLSMEVRAIVCQPDTCNLVDCPNISSSNCTEKQVFDPNGGFCGCCGKCITILGEGENCSLTHLRGVPPSERCGQGLSCKENSNNDSWTCQ